MPIRVTSNGVAGRVAGKLRERARNMLPATRRIGDEIALLARRRAPVRRGSAKLKNSLNHAEPAHNITQLQTDRVYGPIQQRGGTIVPVSAKALAIPLNETARKIAENMPAGLSLRGLDLIYIKGKSGKAFLAVQKGSIDRKGKLKKGQRFRERKTFASPTAEFPARKVKKGARRSPGRRKSERSGRSLRRASRMPDRNDLEVRFVLVPRVTLRPNPSPRGYAPHMDEPEVRAFMNRISANWVLRGSA